MEEAQRLLAVSVWKLYRCRVRRGGLRLHRSLQLSLLVRAARHRYLSARAAAETGPVPAGPCGEIPEPGRDPSGEPRNGPGPNGPSGGNQNRATPGSGQERDWAGENQNRATPATEQERDWTGENPNRASGAPRSERNRRCPPAGPTETPPSPPSGASPAPRTAPDPANRDRDPLSAGAPRAGQKRRSSGPAGPGPGPVPSKRARLEAEAPPLPPGPPGRCSGPPAAAFGFLVRAVGAC